eukprot:Hpha_TRINITY_DN6291_c0_g1::TRINITY_DN6291_c0_g1_i1::g.23609::m.23609
MKPPLLLYSHSVWERLNGQCPLFGDKYSAAVKESWTELTADPHTVRLAQQGTSSVYALYRLQQWLLWFCVDPSAAGASAPSAIEVPPGVVARFWGDELGYSGEMEAALDLYLSVLPQEGSGFELNRAVAGLVCGVLTNLVPVPADLCATAAERTVMRLGELYARENPERSSYSLADWVLRHALFEIALLFSSRGRSPDSAFRTTAPDLLTHTARGAVLFAESIRAVDPRRRSQMRRRSSVAAAVRHPLSPRMPMLLPALQPRPPLQPRPRVPQNRARGSFVVPEQEADEWDRPGTTAQAKSPKVPLYDVLGASSSNLPPISGPGFSVNRAAKRSHALNSKRWGGRPHHPHRADQWCGLESKRLDTQVAIFIAELYKFPSVEEVYLIQQSQHPTLPRM